MNATIKELFIVDEYVSDFRLQFVKAFDTLAKAEEFVGTNQRLFIHPDYFIKMGDKYYTLNQLQSEIVERDLNKFFD